MRLHSKVLVVGGGPAGATAARFLSQHGVETMLLEKNPSFQKPCGGAVPSIAFDELNIPRKTIQRAVRSIRIISPQDNEVMIPLQGAHLAIVERGEFDGTLRKLAQEKGAKTIKGECTGITKSGKLVTLAAKIDGKNVTITSEHVIAADGISSNVRRSLGLQPARWLYTVSQRISQTNTDICEFWFGSSHAPGFYSWVFPTAEGISLGTGCMNPRMLIPCFNVFRERRGIIQDGPRKIYRIPLWQGKLYRSGNVLFAGDSAGQVLPFTYEGIYYAMKAGEFSAAAIVDGKANYYKKLWEQHFRKRFMLMNNLKKYLLRDDSTVEKLVELHKSSEIQEASMRLWLCKDPSTKSFTHYLTFFRKFLR